MTDFPCCDQPSPVPAGTEAAGVALWQLFNAASEQATNDEQDALDEQYELVRSALAAVVSSSPATPAPVDGYCVCDGGSPARDCGIPAHRAAAEAALDRYRAGPFPATPEGGRDRIEHALAVQRLDDATEFAAGYNEALTDIRAILESR